MLPSKYYQRSYYSYVLGFGRNDQNRPDLKNNMPYQPYHPNHFAEINPNNYMEHHLHSNNIESVPSHPLLMAVKEEPPWDEPEVKLQEDIEPISGISSAYQRSFAEFTRQDNSNGNNDSKTKEKNVADQSSRTCKTCGKVLASISSLYVHLKSHSTNKPYVCDDCGATFTRKYYLEVHQRSHTGERPFQCDMCHKFFSQKSSLNTHKRKHTGEKPFQCQYCGKSFSAQSYLSSHLWSHYERDQGGVLRCTTCNDNFTSRTQLVQHMRMHAGTLGFQCNICCRRFSRESYLIRHKKGAHGSSEKNRKKSATNG